MVADKKSMDVSKPGKSAPDTSARPLIVSNKPSSVDPMMKAEDKTEKKIIQHTKIIQPLTPSETTEKPPQETEQDPGKDASTETAEKSQLESTEQIDQSSDKQSTEIATNVTENDQLETSDTKKAKTDGLTPEEIAKQEALKKLILEKKYFVKVKEVNRGRMSWLLSILLFLILLTVGLSLAVDAGYINLGVRLPFDLIKERSEDVAIAKPDSTADESKLSTYETKFGRVTLKYPSGWHVLADEQRSESSEFITVSPKSTEISLNMHLIVRTKIIPDSVTLSYQSKIEKINYIPFKTVSGIQLYVREFVYSHQSPKGGTVYNFEVYVTDKQFNEKVGDIFTDIKSISVNPDTSKIADGVVFGGSVFNHKPADLTSLSDIESVQNRELYKQAIGILKSIDFKK